MRKNRLLPLLLALLLLLAACRSTDPPNGEQEALGGSAPDASLAEEEASGGGEEDLRDEAYQQRRLELFEEHKNYLGGLSAEAMREDFDYFWDTVNTGYPFLGVLERAGIDPQAVYQESLRKLEEEVASDIDFINLFQWVAVQFEGRGHFNPFMGASIYDGLVELYADMAEYSPHCGVLYQTLSSPVAAQSYEKMRPLEEALEEAYREIYGDGGALEAQLPASDGSAGNVSTQLLEDGTVAYIKIQSFGANYVMEDMEEIAAFYQSVLHLPHLVIDITGNGGGSDNYWSSNILNMLQAETVVWRQYALGNTQAPCNQEYLAAMLSEGAELLPIEELPALPAFQTEDLQYLDAFSVSELTLEPHPNSMGYQGRIWVLVDEGVYSSSESFAMFCKSTGFATLVGETTGGDGGGIDPNIFVLPNSGLAYRFSVLYTINDDGSNSEEAGTTPDIIAAAGKTALETCLEAIRAL